MSRGTLVGVVTVAAASLLGLAFVLGRASGSRSGARPAAREQPDSVAAQRDLGPRAADRRIVPPAPSGASITDSVEAGPARGPTPAVPEDRPLLQPTFPPASAPSSGERGSAASESERDAVAAYLDEVDRIEPGKMSGSAESVASEMVAALAKGDTSGLDRMIRETEAAREKLAALTPPASGAAYQRESLGSLDDALEVLRSLKTAVESPDPPARLTDVATRAAALRSRAEALQKEESALRQRYGLSR